MSIVLAFAFFASLQSVMTAEFDYKDFRGLGIRGWAFESLNEPVFRLPPEAEHQVRGEVWALAQDTAGMYVDFLSDSPTIMVNYTLLKPELEMYHFPSTGCSGLDLYRFDNESSDWRWVGTTRLISYPKPVVEAIGEDLPATGMAQYRLHLPLYNGLTSLEVGVVRGRSLMAMSEASKPVVVWYGTSIAQGAVASRPGQAYMNILRRELNYEIYNFGFSGNGIMEISVAQFLCDIHDVDLFVIDCLPNMDASMVKNKTVPLVKYIRQFHPDIPIVLAEGTPYGQAWIVTGVSQAQQLKRQALQGAYDMLKNNGDMNLHYVFGDSLLNTNHNYVNPTVGGTHPTDLGMYEIADFYKTFLPTVIKHQSKPYQMNREKTYKSADELGENSPSNMTQHVSIPAQNYTFIDLVDIGIQGRGFNNTPTPYNRLPYDAHGVIRDKVWSLSLMSTGLFVEFLTDATEFYLNYTLSEPAQSLWHMSLTGTSGCDLFAYDEDKDTWRFVATVIDIPEGSQTLAGWLVKGLEPPSLPTKYRLFLPMRAEIINASIAIPSISHLSASQRDQVPLPIVWYGTSITQGGAVARAGSTFTNILSRNLGRDVLNLGFAGNGKMELDVAKFLVQIQAAMFVIDCNPNLNAEEVSQRTGPLVKYIREFHPTTPLVLAEGSTYGDDWLDTGTGRAQMDKRSALRKAYEDLQAEGVEHLHYAEGKDLFEERPFVNPTVGGTHPSDLGHREIAKFYTTFLPPILSSE